MDIDHLLKRGSDVANGKGLHERKSDKRSQGKEIGEEIVSLAQEIGLKEAAEQCGISETAASKFLARALKKLPALSADMLIDPTKVRAIESLIQSCNTTSVTKITLAARGAFSEAEIRVVKAQIEKNGVGNWDC